MSRAHTLMTAELTEYLRSVSLRESEVLARLRVETAALPEATMQISPEQGQFLGLLARATGVRNAVEVGVFTGYSSTCVAQALPPGGRLTACDLNPEWTAVARRYWREAKVEDRIELRLGPAVETLSALLSERGEGTFDFGFIDADKANYDEYYERLLQLIRPGGLIAIDNVLWHGRVADLAAQDDDTRAIRALNTKLLGDQRVWISMLPVGDGLTLALKL